MALLIESRGERAALAGDIWLHPSQVADPDLVCAFDMDPVVARQTREEWAERLEREDALVGVSHFPQPFGKVVRSGDGHQWTEFRRWD